jgi:hypothetical protein
MLSQKVPFTPFDVGSLIRAEERRRYLRANGEDRL